MKLQTGVFYKVLFQQVENPTGEHVTRVYSFCSSICARNSALVLATLACLAASPILAAFHLFLVTLEAALALGDGSLRMAAWH